MWWKKRCYQGTLMRISARKNSLNESATEKSIAKRFADKVYVGHATHIRDIYGWILYTKKETGRHICLTEKQK